MDAQPLLLIVEKNKRNLELLTQFLGKAGYRTIPATTLEVFDQTLGMSEAINLALVDISGFDKRIWERCEQLREKKIPLLIISQKYATEIQHEGITRGAQSILVKPLLPNHLLSIVKGLLQD